MNIRQAIWEIIKDNITDEVFLCTVTSIDEGYATCEVVQAPEIDTPPQVLTGVRLQARLGAAGLLLMPAVGSFVVVVQIAPFDYAIIMYSELDSIRLRSGSFGGLVKVAPLIQKINTLESRVNALLSAFNAHTHPGVTAGAGVTAPSATKVSGAITETRRDDIENKEVTHG